MGFLVAPEVEGQNLPAPGLMAVSIITQLESVAFHWVTHKGDKGEADLSAVPFSAGVSKVAKSF